jgi:hypothetical protein
MPGPSLPVKIKILVVGVPAVWRREHNRNGVHDKLRKERPNEPRMEFDTINRCLGQYHDRKEAGVQAGH